MLPDLNNFKIDIKNGTPRAKHLGGGVVYEFWLKTPAEIPDLPPPGSWAANTSIAWIKSTDQLGTLDDTGWIWD